LFLEAVVAPLIKSDPLNKKNYPFDDPGASLAIFKMVKAIPSLTKDGSDLIESLRAAMTSRLSDLTWLDGAELGKGNVFAMDRNWFGDVYKKKEKRIRSDAKLMAQLLGISDVDLFWMAVDRGLSDKGPFHEGHKTDIRRLRLACNLLGKGEEEARFINGCQNPTLRERVFEIINTEKIDNQYTRDLSHPSADAKPPTTYPMFGSLCYGGNPDIQRMGPESIRHGILSGATLPTPTDLQSLEFFCFEPLRHGYGFRKKSSYKFKRNDIVFLEGGDNFKSFNRIITTKIIHGNEAEAMMAWSLVHDFLAKTFGPTDQTEKVMNSYAAILDVLETHSHDLPPNLGGFSFATPEFMDLMHPEGDHHHLFERTVDLDILRGVKTIFTL